MCVVEERIEVYFRNLSLQEILAFLNLHDCIVRGLIVYVHDKFGLMMYVHDKRDTYLCLCGGNTLL